jgi:hypothetical protein
MASRALNFIYFHRRRIAVTAGFCGAYGMTCHSAIKWKNDVLRLGIAGSLATVFIEAAFHMVDTVNIRAKSQAKQISTFKMTQLIYRGEGLKGFSKGFSAAFYGGVAYGFTYFVIYKVLKEKLKERLESKVDLAVVYLLAAFLTEVCSLSV